MEVQSVRVTHRPADRDETDVLDWLRNERDRAANARDAGELSGNTEEWSRWDARSTRLSHAISEIESSRERIAAMTEALVQRIERHLRPKD